MLADINITVVMDVRDKRIVSIFFEHKVHMAWPVRMTIQDVKELAYWPIMRDRVWYRDNTPEPKVAHFIAFQDCPTIWTAPICVLHIVKPL